MSLDFVPIKLPSKCLTYLDTDPDNIRIRPFRGEDEQLVAEFGLENKKKVLELLNNILQGIDPKLLTAGDLMYILIWEGINSYSNLYPLRLTCSDCLQTVDVNIDLGQLDSKELPDDYIEPQELILSKQKVQVKLLTLADDIEITKWIEAGKEMYLYTFARSLVCEGLDTMGALEILKNLDTKDLKTIRDFHEKYIHGPDLNSSYVCPKCDSEGKVIVPFRLESLIFASSKS